MAAMTSVWEQLEPHLLSVEKPARYIGMELGAHQGEPSPGAVRWLLCYPDTYEVGLPNQGLQILYELINEHPRGHAERAYAPWVDLEAVLRREGIPLFSLEHHRPAREFHVLGFNVAAELTCTNVLNLIDLAGLAVRSANRTEGDPLVVIGGHCTYNPEPLADFVDAAVLGDGEEVVLELTSVLATLADRGASRDEVLDALCAIEGVYVPSRYEARFLGPAAQETVPVRAGVPEVVTKRTISDLGQWPYPKQQLVPLTEVVHDRLNVEAFRGCTRGCRFCQAGMITRPVRERPADQVVEMVAAGLERTGYDEVTLTSLSTADFSAIEPTVQRIIDAPETGERVSVSLPSLRVDAFTVATAAQIQRVRRTGLTFAPEGGTWRMRQVINKLISEEDLYAAVDAAFSQGWRRVKLYFLIGLPTETDEDVLAIAELGRRCVELGRRYHHGVTVTCSVGGFVPKAMTPFQWAAQDTVEELRRKVNLLREASRGIRGLSLRWHEPEASFAEGLVSRGDRRMGAVLERVWRDGGTFQEWSEFFTLNRWIEALEAEGLEAEAILHRERPVEDPLAWDHLSAGLHRDFLVDDWAQAKAHEAVEDCRWTPCYDCGACTGGVLEHVVASTTPPAGGSQGTGQDRSRGGEVPVHLTGTRR